MTAAACGVDAGSAASRLTLSIEVRGLRRFRARLWLGALIMRLGARVVGAKCRVQVHIER